MKFSAIIVAALASLAVADMDCVITGNNVNSRPCPCASSKCPSNGQVNKGYKFKGVAWRQGSTDAGNNWWVKTEKGNYVNWNYADCYADGTSTPTLAKYNC